MHYFVSFLVLQTTLRERERERESYLFCFYCLADVLFLLMFCPSSSMCLLVGLQCVIVVFPNHTHLHFSCNSIITKNISSDAI